jgi:hypothetical protein
MAALTMAMAGDPHQRQARCFREQLQKVEPENRLIR